MDTTLSSFSIFLLGTIKYYPIHRTIQTIKATLETVEWVCYLTIPIAGEPISLLAFSRTFHYVKSSERKKISLKLSTKTHDSPAKMISPFNKVYISFYS